ncbi:MAG: Mu-like prophage major head subunit gpT family protein [Myxococcales bacterium]
MSAMTPAKYDAATLTFSSLFRQVLEETPTYYEKIATEIPSTTREMRHAWLDRIPAMREWLGERVVNNLAVRLQSIENRLFEDTIAVKRVDIEDDLIGVYRPVIEELAQQAKVWPDKLVTDTLQAAKDLICYDGQPFFDTNHPQNMDDPSSPLQSNLLKSHPLTWDALEDAITTMSAFIGADGKPLEIIPDLLVVPPQRKFAAARLLQSELIARDIALASGHGAAADTNVLKGSLDLMVLPRLATEPNAYYVLCTKRAVKPLIFQNREAPEFAALTQPNDENVFQRDELLYGVRARGAAGLGPYFLAVRCEA